MDGKEAIYRIENHIEHHKMEEPHSRFFPIYNALEMALEALAKEIPKKPTDVYIDVISFQGSRYERFIGKCSVCGATVFSTWNICIDCGNAVDWSE
jgi:hypothetical protein